MPLAPRRPPRVCLLQRFCPFCFKGTSESCGLYVSPSNLRIDYVQAMHSRARNGLPLLDLREPGEFCKEHAVCQIRCLVCGKTVVDGESDEFEEFFSICQGREQVVGDWAIIDKALEDCNAVMTSSWNTPIHKHCAKKAACKCWVPLGEYDCREHGKRRPPPEQVSDPKAGQMKGVKLTKPAKPPPAVLEHSSVGATAIGKAEWFKPSPAGARVLTELGDSVVQSAGIRMPPPKPKPNARLVAAAKGTSSITVWASSALPAAIAQAPGPLRGVFNWEQHQFKFDDAVHGYFRTREGSFYRFPDGRVVPVRCGVGILTPDGELLDDM